MKKSILNDRNVGIFKDVINGSTYQEVATSRGLSPERIRQIVMSIRRIFNHPKNRLDDPRFEASSVVNMRKSADFWIKNVNQLAINRMREGG